MCSRCLKPVFFQGAWDEGTSDAWESLLIIILGSMRKGMNGHGGWKSQNNEEEEEKAKLKYLNSTTFSAKLLMNKSENWWKFQSNKSVNFIFLTTLGKTLWRSR
jgi:hypothetical protein